MPRQATSGKRLSVWTSLPASPVDGQEILYRFQQTVLPADLQWLNWHLRWDAAAGVWLPVGQQEPIMAQDIVGRSQSFGTGWSQYSAQNLWLATTLAGVYRFKFGANFLYNNVISNNQVGLAADSVWTGANGSLYCYGANHNVAYGGAMASVKYPRLLPQVVSWGVFPGTAGTVTSAGRFIEAYPVQIG